MIFDKMAVGYGSFGLGRGGPRVTSGMGVPGGGGGGDEHGFYGGPYTR